MESLTFFAIKFRKILTESSSSLVHQRLLLSLPLESHKLFSIKVLPFFLKKDIYDLKGSSLMILFDYVNRCLKEMAAAPSSFASKSSRKRRSRKPALIPAEDGSLSSPSSSPSQDISDRLLTPSSKRSRSKRSSPPPSPVMLLENLPLPLPFPLSGPPRNCSHSSQDVIHIFKREQVLTLQISENSDEDVDVL